MSNTIFENDDITFTACVGPAEDRLKVHVVIGNYPKWQSTTLSSDETRQLIKALENRLACVPGFRATD